MQGAKEAREAEEAAGTQDRSGSTRKVSIKLPASVVKVIEAAETLGISDDLENFVIEATIEKAEGLRQKIQTVIGRENNIGRGKRGGNGL